MPNTLAHIGAQLPFTKVLFRNTDPRWVALGLLIPDLPWIFQRLIHICIPGLSAIDVRAFVVVMSTPLYCMVLAAAVSLLFRQSKWIFFMLSLQCMLHEFLDSIQEKGGVGVPFFGPFNWHSFAWPLFPMDGWISLLLTAMGGCAMVWLVSGKMKYSKITFCGASNHWRVFASSFLIILYAVSPFHFMQGAIDANVHDLKIWNGSRTRTGTQVHFDRANYTPGHTMGRGGIQDDFNPEPIPIEGILTQHPALVSTIATFKDEETLVAGNYVIHPNGRRFWYTITGLIAVILFWVYPLIKSGKPHS